MKHLALLLASLTLGTAAQAAPLSWGDIRDGSLYLLAPRGDTLDIRWRPAWQAEANHERLYLLDGQGQLQAERHIPPEQARGHQRWPLPASDNAYRLEIPGYSFRRYRVEYSDGTRALFAPAKVHFSAEVGPGVTLFFQVPAGVQATLAGKYHGGVRGLQVQRLGDERQLELTLKPYRAYWQFDQLALPVSSTAQTYRLHLQGRGKAAFWLDGSANLFAQRAADLGPLPSAEGKVALRLGGRVLGPTPSLGVNLPYVMPPPSSHAVLDALQPRAAGYYSLLDLLARKPNYENDFRRFYQQRYPITQDITLLSGTGRRSVLAADRTSDDGLDAWLTATRELGGKALHYLAFADEPNLNYSDYASYRRYFQAMLERVQRFPGAREAGVRIAMPASSNLVNGPFHEGSRQRIGLDWSRRLLAEHDAQIDALAWHEWMVRDLLATRSYRDSVRQAAALVGLDDQGRPRKALLLDQTNMSSGSSLSRYDQDTHYASLWWASVVVNASADGLLDMLNWFHVADEPEWPKGMVRVLGEDHFELKPVGLAQQFIQRHWLTQVLSLDNDAFEVDALAMAEGRQRSLLGVNKTERVQQVGLTLAGTPARRECPQGQLQLFGPDSQARQAAFTCRDGTLHFQLPGQTLFALTWSAP
ncbi:hypothetical protein NJF44_19280 [Pseudomonas guariconensis]|uniref:hypothetical protein n=1 Tax=Pseudomonas TaxID=286 RepID=UPI001CE49FA8|nr:MULTISPECIES: hypothetical protein [Pseudomonas]MCO7642684.1 hypothetical protein [Pseudomonas sp. S 311-6]MCO7517007.1 hypothetical protein [Pseudomonas putida]MCO7564131.1 hypothetical protein [Pseudomonas mosselii]MCO7607376.1 hypothetical protein [Pseudomonas guariconensis]MCO7618506.1 hypothetical protein [Pseudomonas guariconensis]